MVVIVDALSGWNQSYVGYHNTTAQAQKLVWAKHYTAYCASNPRCVAMLPFLWTTVAGAAEKQQDACCWGLKDMPVSNTSAQTSILSLSLSLPTSLSRSTSTSTST